MEFEWDEAKSQACFQERGFDFEYAAQAFFDPNRQVLQDSRRVYGEDRFQLLGSIAGRVSVLVYTPRAGVFLIISTRKANSREAEVYDRHAKAP